MEDGQPNFEKNLAPYIVIGWVLSGGYRLLRRPQGFELIPGLGTSLSEEQQRKI